MKFFFIRIVLICTTTIYCEAINTKLNFDMETNCLRCAPYGTEGNFGENRMHTGKDYILPINTELSAMSYGKVKFRYDMPVRNVVHTGRADHGMGNVLEIQYLLNNGSYVTSSYNHLNSFPYNVDYNDYVSSEQIVAFSGASGQESLTYWNDEHLHLEMKNNPRTLPIASPWGYTKNSKDPADYGYLDPDDYINKKNVILPTLSRTNNPSYLNFDVYGIADKTIYGYLNIGTDNIDKVGILARNSKKRSDAENSNTTYNTQEFLAESTSDFIGLSGNSNKYSKGDYLFVPYIKDNGQHRYGYPLKFSFLDEGSFIIDNDKNNITYDNGASYSEYLSRTNANEKNSVPGYFLTSRLIKVTSTNYNDYVKWSVPGNTDGKYHIYAHIPKGATATDTKYTIRTSDGDKTKKINQGSATKEDWVDLGTYSLNSDSYVKLSLRNQTNGQWMAFDAIKFEKVAGLYNGTGSIIEPSKKAIGGNQDIVALQAGDNSMGSFQWHQKDGYCPHLLIKNDNDTNEVSKVLIVRKNWSNSAILSSFETSLPFSLSSEQNNKYDTILIKSLSPLTKKNEIRAICSDNTSYSFRNSTTNPNFITENGYTWTGNGSIISKELTGTGIGKTKDIAYKGSDKKSLTIFQWQPSDRCKKLKISGAYYNQGFHRGYGFSGKLSTKIWNSSTYNNDKTPINFPYTLSGVSGAFYMIEIRTDGVSSSYPYIYAECKN